MFESYEPKTKAVSAYRIKEDDDLMCSFMSSTKGIQVGHKTVWFKYSVSPKAGDYIVLVGDSYIHLTQDKFASMYHIKRDGSPSLQHMRLT